MEQTLIQLQQNQLIHNVYCPTVEQTIATCELEMLKLHTQQKAYFEIPFEQFNDVYHHFHKNDFIKKGAFTYMQVCRIAETGNIHQLKISEEGRIYFTDESISMSTAISFAQSKWNGATREEAIENAVLTGLTIIGEAFAEDVITMQIKHANVAEHINLDKSLKDAIQKSSAKNIIKKMTTKATKKASAIVAKKTGILRNENIVTGAVVTRVMSSVDIASAIREKMSPQQLLGHITKTVVSVASSVIGIIVGWGIGFNFVNASMSLISVIGGIIGLIIGSVIASKIAKKISVFFIKEDAIEMLDIFNAVFALEAEIFLLNEQELSQAINDFKAVYTMDEEMRKMYVAHDRGMYAKVLIENELSRILKLRMYLQIPTNEELYKVIELIQ